MCQRFIHSFLSLESTRLPQEFTPNPAHSIPQSSKVHSFKREEAVVVISSLTHRALSNETKLQQINLKGEGRITFFLSRQVLTFTAKSCGEFMCSSHLIWCLSWNDLLMIFLPPVLSSPLTHAANSCHLSLLDTLL